MDIECDVLIVGGGPAGLSVASSLADNISSVVVHQDAEIGKPVRTSGGSWVKDLQELDIPPHLYQVVNQIDLYSDNEKASFKAEKNLGAVLDVTALYQYLASLSEAKNHRLLLSSKFITAEKYADGHYISTIRSRAAGDTKIKSKYIVDASGWHSVVIRDQGLGHKPTKIGIASEYEFDLGDNNPQRIILFLGSAAHKGYGWIFPTADNKLRIGLGSLKSALDQTPRQRLDDFLAAGHLKRYGITIDDNEIKHVMAGIMPMVVYEKNLVFGNIIRVGDSANYATPTVLEGIKTCIKYGRLLGEQLSKAIEGDSTKHLKAYEKQCNRDLKMNYLIGYSMAKRNYDYTVEDWDKSIRRAGRLSEDELVGLLRCEFSVNMIVKVIYKNIRAKLFG